MGKRPTISAPAVGAGVRDWFEREVARCRRQLYVHALRLSRNKDDAEDIVAKAVLKGWAAIASFDRASGSSFSSWMYKIATREFLDIRRMQARRPQEHGAHAVGEDGEALVREPVDASPLPDALPRALREDVEAALKGLHGPAREAVRLYYVEGLSAAEGAEAMGCGVSAFRSRLFRGRRQMQKALDRAKPSQRGTSARSCARRS